MDCCCFPAKRPRPPSRWENDIRKKIWRTIKGPIILFKVQTTTRLDYVWPEVWTKIGEATQNRETQEWAKEKPKLDNARRLERNIDPNNEEYKENPKIARRKLERLIAPTKPCKRQSSITKVVAKPKIVSEKNSKTMTAKHNENEFITMCDCVVKDLLRCLMTIWCTSSSKVKSKKEVILEAQRDKKKVHFAALMDTCQVFY